MGSFFVRAVCWCGECICVRGICKDFFGDLCYAIVLQKHLQGPAAAFSGQHVL